MKVINQIKLLEVGDKNKHWEVVKRDYHKLEYVYRCIHCGNLRKGKINTFRIGKCKCRNMEIEQMKEKGSEEKEKTEKVLKSNKNVNSIPDNLDAIACKRLICAILNQAWRDSKDNRNNDDIPYFLDSKLCDSLCIYADINTEKYKEVVTKRLEFAYRANARALAEMARDKIIENTTNEKYINGHHIEWDMEKRIVYVTINKFVYCANITEDYKFIGWKIDGTEEQE